MEYPRQVETYYFLWCMGRGGTLKKYPRQVETKFFLGRRGRGGTLKKYPRHVQTENRPNPCHYYLRVYHLYLVMLGWSTSHEFERITKKFSIYIKVLYWNLCERTEYNDQNLSQNSLCPGLDSKRTPLEVLSEILPPDPNCLFFIAQCL